MSATAPPETSVIAFDDLLRRQRAAFAHGAPDEARRKWALRTLRDAVLANQGRLADAISDDFGGRSRDETRMLELLPVIDLIGHARRSLGRWIKRRPDGSTWFLRPSSAYTVCQPLGVVGIMGAWNYPVLLTLGPLVSALAAGNHAMIKPSEKTPRTAALLAEILSEAFPADYVAAVVGDVEAAKEFSALPFDHLVFTGSTATGVHIMRAASTNLTPVTLELGGKTPAIVHRDFPFETALQRILVGKLYNAGQTCIAPDYLLVPRARIHEVESLATAIIGRLYPRLVDNHDYTHIAGDIRYRALASMVAEARDGGARIVSVNPAGETCSAANGVFPPTLVFDPDLSGRLMTEEIFGPILPVVPYDSLDDAIAFVNARPRPLALYYFDTAASRVDRVVNGTTSGGVTVNDVILHIAQHNLPFGGVGASGMGHYHGYDGFLQLSKKKGVMVQSRFPLTRMLAPPFSTAKRGLIGRILMMASR